MIFLIQHNEGQVSIFFLAIFGNLPYLLYFIWIYSIAKYTTQALVAKNITINFLLFQKIFLVLCMVLFVFPILQILFVKGVHTYIMLPVALIFMPIFFYCLVFTTKSFKMLELNRKVKYSDYGDFFLGILFFPIGIWFIQPKLNKLKY